MDVVVFFFSKERVVAVFFFFLKKRLAFLDARLKREEGKQNETGNESREARGLLACRAVTGGHKTRIEGISRLIQVHSEHPGSVQDTGTRHPLDMTSCPSCS